MTEITRRCLSLQRKDKERLIKVLTESLEEKDNGEDRFKVLYTIATAMVGHGILTSSREYNLVMARRMIVYKMREENYSWSAIGRHLIKHHASVMHMYKMMSDVLEMPHAFGLEITYWNEFNKRINEYDTNKRTTQDS